MEEPSPQPTPVAQEPTPEPAEPPSPAEAASAPPAPESASPAENATPETAAGQHFWVWLRNMVVDAYYTSPVGVQDIGFMGNKVLGSFSVPQEAVDYVMKRSPV